MTTIANEIELESPPENPFPGGPIVETSLPYLAAVKVHLWVRVGAAQVSVAELMDLRQGGVVELDRLVDQPLDVMLDEHVVARGVLVAVGDNFGVRITEAATAAPAVGDAAGADRT